MSNQSENQL